ncbi:hypothetical protein [Lentibacillus sediminis]|nr:hypothetical protein [Lentibacillus sediminis]
MAEAKKKKDQTWILDILFTAGELLLYFPRIVAQFVKGIFS